MGHRKIYMKRITILGSTGSVGKQTLEVIRALKGNFKVEGLSCYRNTNLLLKQIKEFKPKVVSVLDEEKGLKLKRKLGGKPRVLFGQSSLGKLATLKEVDLVVISLAGLEGIAATLEAIKAKKFIALASKEILVAAGPLIKKALKIYKTELFPIDSEHSAIWQCLQGEDKRKIRRVILTCSGGPFFRKTYKELKKVTPNQALKHPNWKMGAKITIDSATLMNKGFEVIEAAYLFDLPPEKIEVVIHPQSIIHSMVEFVDGSIKAQLAARDMRLAIQYALTYPERLRNPFAKLDFFKLEELTFLKPDSRLFPCLNYGWQALKVGGTLPAALAAADEKAINLFLEGKISFLDISKVIKRVMDSHKVIKKPTLNDILETIKWAKENILSTV